MKYTDYYNHLLAESENDKQIIPIPKEPGTVPIPNNHLRLYHYTDASTEELKRNGLLLNKAKGHTYGEPNFVWASLQKPPRYKRYVEFSVPIDDSRFSTWGSKPDARGGVEYYKGKSNDFTFMGDIKPDEFIAIHEPWHHVYRYLVDKKQSQIKNILNGEYDYLIDDRYSNEAEAIKAVKVNFAK